MKTEYIRRRTAEIIAQELEEMPLTPKSKDILAKSAIEIYEKIEEVNIKPYYTKLTVALKLSCDKHSCGINPLKNKRISFKKMNEARKLSGVERILDPRQRVDAMVNILYNNDKIPESLTEVIKTKAKEDLTEYKERTKYRRHDPYIEAAGSIYTASLQCGYHIGFSDISDCTDISKVGIRSAAYDIAEIKGIDVEQLRTDAIYRTSKERDDIVIGLLKDNKAVDKKRGLKKRDIMNMIETKYPKKINPINLETTLIKLSEKGIIERKVRGRGSRRYAFHWLNTEVLKAYEN